MDLFIYLKKKKTAFQIEKKNTKKLRTMPRLLRDSIVEHFPFFFHNFVSYLQTRKFKLLLQGGETHTTKKQGRGM